MNGRVIVVDDDNSILDLLRVLLESEGYEVEAFDSPRAALDAAIAQPPDVAVVDLMMPGLTGLDFIQELRQNAVTQDTPVILCSAYYGDLQRTSIVLKQDGVYCLRKPFPIDDLLDAVIKSISRSEQRAGEPGSGKGLRPSFLASTASS